MNSDVIAAHDLLIILSPPIRLIEWLERAFAAKQDKGEQLPTEYVRWLERWRVIRSDLPSEIDYIDEETWLAAGKIVGASLQKIQVQP